MEEEVGAPVIGNPRFLIGALWLFVAAALWLLLSPAAFERRERTASEEELTAATRREWVRSAGLERWRDALESDPVAIEREARKMGYGRLGERDYLLSARELRAVRPRTIERESGEFELTDAVRRGVAPAIMLMIAGVIAALFFTDLRLEEPEEAAGEGAPNGDRV